MKKAIISGVRQAKIIECDKPSAIDDWVLVKVHAAPMCAEYKSFIKGQKTNYLGHEAAGEVVEVADSCNLEIGDRVVVMPLFPCGKCEFCISGDYIHCEHQLDQEKETEQAEGSATYAQYLLKQSWLLQKIPDNLTYEKASLACCGLGPSFGAMEAMQTSAFDVVLIAGLGPVGLGAVVNAFFRGARVIAMEMLPWRIDRARKMGVEHILDPFDADVVNNIKELTGGKGVDCAIDCTGMPDAQRICIDSLRRKGKMSFVGEAAGDLTINGSQDMIRKGISLIGAWHYNLNLYPQLIQVAMRSPLIELLISHELPMSQILEAFELSASPEHAKIILNPWT